MRHRSLHAGALSVVLHVSVILALGVLPWSLPDGPEPEPRRFIRIVEPALARNAGAVPAAEAARALETFGPIAPQRLPEPELPEPIEPPVPVPPPVPELEPEPELEERTPPETTTPEEAPSPDAPVVESSEEPAEPEGLPRDVDWEAERKRAAREVVEQRALEQSYRTFSLEDFDEFAPPEEPDPEPDFFEGGGGGGSSGPSLLEPGKPRSRAGRWLADICHSLTGGMGVMGLSLCADNDVRNDLFATIKPGYLKARPECTEVEQPAGLDADAVKKTHDCRLVIPEE